jgi:hypothetical protein
MVRHRSTRGDTPLVVAVFLAALLSVAAQTLIGNGESAATALLEEQGSTAEARASVTPAPASTDGLSRRSSTDAEAARRASGRRGDPNGDAGGASNA